MQETGTEDSAGILSLSDDAALKQIDVQYGNTLMEIFETKTVLATPHEQSKNRLGVLYTAKGDLMINGPALAGPPGQTITNVSPTTFPILTSSLIKEPLIGYEEVEQVHFGGDGWECSGCEGTGHMVGYFDKDNKPQNCHFCAGKNVIAIPFTEWWGQDLKCYED